MHREPQHADEGQGLQHPHAHYRVAALHVATIVRTSGRAAAAVFGEDGKLSILRVAIGRWILLRAGPGFEAL